MLAWQFNQTGKGSSYWGFLFFRTEVQPPRIPEHLQPLHFGDSSGGPPVHVQKGTGYFTVAKMGNRWTFATPNEHGTVHAPDLLVFSSAAGRNDDHYIMGINFWELVDNNSEKTNWGLLTRKDNATMAKRRCVRLANIPGDTRIGREDQGYDDPLSMVRNINFEIQERLSCDLAPFEQKSVKSKK